MHDTYTGLLTVQTFDTLPIWTCLLSMPKLQFRLLLTIWQEFSIPQKDVACRFSFRRNWTVLNEVSFLVHFLLLRGKLNWTDLPVFRVLSGRLHSWGVAYLRDSPKVLNLRGRCFQFWELQDADLWGIRDVQAYEWGSDDSGTLIYLWRNYKSLKYVPTFLKNQNIIKYETKTNRHRRLPSWVYSWASANVCFYPPAPSFWSSTDSDNVRYSM